MSRSTVMLLAIGAVLAVLIAAAAAGAALLGDEKRFEEGSPERAVQAYLEAVEDKDASAAFALLAPELETRCGLPPREAITRYGDASLRATLTDTDTDGATATVHVRLTETFGDSPLDFDDYAQSLVFELERTEGTWRFVEMPWPLFCARPGAFPQPPQPAQTAQATAEGTR